MVRIYAYICLARAVSTLAQLQKFTPPGQEDITYSVTIPQDTASSGSGPIYFQLRSMRQVQWLAWGQGNQMRGANIFVVYTSGNNVTVSPRLAEGHIEPKYNPHAQISVLNGTGVRDGIITANVRCDSCISWPGGSEDITSTSSPWIWAVKYGPPLGSDNVAATIAEHDHFGVTLLNLKRATGGSSETLLQSPTAFTSNQTMLKAGANSINWQIAAHAVLMLLTFTILFPAFALALHLFPSFWTVKLHASSQLLTLGLVVIGMGFGISIAKASSQTGTYHAIIGIGIVSSLVLYQPVMGLLQHRYFRKTGGKSSFAYLHRWFGRALISFGVINGGLGLNLAGVGSPGAPLGAVIAYGVVSGVIGLGYIFIIGLLGRRKRQAGAV